MELASRKRLMVFSGSGNEPLAEEVANILGVRLGGVERSIFANGEIYVHYTESVRGADTFVIQSHCHPINFHIMEQLIMIDALMRASAKRITAVVPFYGYARQDKKGRPREPISARLMGDLFLQAGADRIVSLDLHTGQIQGFVDAPFDHLTAIRLFADYVEDTLQGPTTIVSPDAGRVKLASRFAAHLDARVAFVHKRRAADVRNEMSILWVVGEVENRHCIIIDDMVDTAGTLCHAAKALKEGGAKKVMAYCTHPVLSGKAMDNIDGSVLDELVVTDTIQLNGRAAESSRIRQLSVAELLAESMRRMNEGESVSSLFMD